jgi:hypothetical protein
VTVAVCGASVPVVWEVLEVVERDAVDVEAAREVVVVDWDDGLLEQAASATAHTARISTRPDLDRSAPAIGRA